MNILKIIRITANAEEIPPIVNNLFLLILVVLYKYVEIPLILLNIKAKKNKKSSIEKLTIIADILSIKKKIISYLVDGL